MTMYLSYLNLYKKRYLGEVSQIIHSIYVSQESEKYFWLTSPNGKWRKMYPSYLNLYQNNLYVGKVSQIFHSLTMHSRVSNISDSLRRLVDTWRCTRRTLIFTQIQACMRSESNISLTFCYRKRVSEFFDSLCQLIIDSWRTCRT